MNAGSIFWKNILSEESVRHLIEKLRENELNDDLLIPQFAGILADKERFISNVLKYRISVCDQGIGPQDYFKQLETLEILCQLRNALSSDNFELHIQSGYLLDEFSLADVAQNCMNPARNPYLSLIKRDIIPAIMSYSPDVLFLTGRISLFNAAIANIVKSSSLNTHISYTQHSTEYYSISKMLSCILMA
ncbi:protein of unknown function [Azospirillum lipoferum 4B]|uniref:Uncharacterized protein n=1 Tax=Azospirillum lipoferum (strain 4B) TaxID=862719 RepID=G7Z2E0_AZOL4|nr:protein of unknown function [Azospirillum lipoferum 4B]